ncbi:ABC transporter substrate-binding protein [Arthrobacter sp. ISL-95]|uniref:ABC transporter substrate-binding protein n=1 Tax=Arthrobacter sp. ISL-95 TaxID=2819116 RepID=UPI001BE4F61F|nr:extracellular solute-binding protein [Arthrobacter sp. ISL-95]MBT2588360.1 extracellular solute-binding protein [Arthrobacter sp. ISL-95]
MKKQLLAGVCAATLLLVGCSPRATNTNDSERTLRITWWGNTARAEATQAAIELFQKKNPKIKIEAVPSSFDGYYNKLNTQFASSSAPDIFQDDQVATFADNGLLLDLNEYKNIIDTSSIDPKILNQATIDGKLLEVPAGTSPMSFVFKKGVLDAAGVAAPDSKDSWDDLAKKAAALKPSLPAGTWALADSSNQPNHFEVFLRQRGKGWFSPDGKSLGFDAQDAADWWSYWSKLRSDGLVPPADITTGGAGGDVSQNPVAKNLVSMGIYGTSITLPSEEWSYGPIPNEAGNPGVYKLRSASWAVNSKTKYPEDAAKLVNFLVNDPEASALLKLTRGVPASDTALKSVRDSLAPKDKQIVAYADYLNQDGNSGTGPNPDPAGTRGLRSDIFTRYSGEVIFGKQTPQSAAEAMIKAAQDLIESLK